MPPTVKELVIVGLARAMVIVSVALPVPALLVADTVALEVPAVVGVPEITPVDELMDNPAGSPDALNEVGVLDPVTVNENAAPVVPLAVDALVMTGGPV